MTDTTTDPAHLTFTATTDAVGTHPPPEPANKSLPAWYQMLSSSTDALSGHHKKSTVKMCMPFGDALKSGWLLKAPTDIEFTNHPDDDRVHASVPSTETDSDNVVTTFPVDQPDREGNSAFLLPNAVINTQWEIQTPDGYSALVVPPINRSEERFTSLGLFAETDTETGVFELPILVERTPVMIEEGDPIAQIIPIKRSTLLDDPVIDSYSPDSKMGKIKHHFERFNDVRVGFYRNELWTPKPGGRNFTSYDAFQDHVSMDADSQATVDDRPDLVEEDRPFLPDDAKHVFYCREKFNEAVPKPKPAETHIPDGYGEALRDLGLGTETHPTAKWAMDAMELGYIVELDRPLHISRDPENGFDAFHAENEGENSFHQHVPEKIGDAHRFSPMEILNVFSQWSVVMEHGYSNFYSSPINHFQRDHRSFSGIVDADWYQGEVNIPGKFTERSDEATLSRGAAITQAIPLQRDALLQYAVINDNDT
jgi:hypothetical protein